RKTGRTFSSDPCCCLLRRARSGARARRYKSTARGAAVTSRSHLADGDRPPRRSVRASVTAATTTLRTMSSLTLSAPEVARAAYADRARKSFAAGARDAAASALALLVIGAGARLARADLPP